MTNITDKLFRHRRLRPGQLRKRLSLTAIYLILAIGAIVSILPFVWMVLGAFKTFAEISHVPPTFWPQEWVLVNFDWAWNKIRFPRLFANSMAVTLTVTAFTLYSSALVGYVLEKFRFPGRNVIFFVVISQMFIPGQLAMLVRWLMFHEVQLLDTLAALIIPILYSTFGIFLLRQYMHTVPNEMLDAARIDGCSEIGIFHRIVLPNIGPALSALGIFTFLWVYNDFTWPLMALSSVKHYTVPLGLSHYQERYAAHIEYLMAGSALAVIPVVLVFIVFQRRITEGVTLTGMGKL